MTRKPPPASDTDVSTKCHDLAAAFYARVDENPTLRPLFPGKSHKCAIEALAAFLVQFLDGPPTGTQRRWWLSLRESHLRFRIGQKERDAWMEQMNRAMRDVEIGEPMRNSLQELFGQASAYLVNTGPAIPPAGGAPEHRWEEQLALDDAVAAVREGQLPRLIALTESPLLQSRFQRNRTVFAHFVGTLVGSGQDAMAECALQMLRANPDLAHERYSGRTLLHAACAAGNLPMVTALLRMGVDANVKDEGGHTPLYCVGNECPAGGGAVVRALAQSGANVDACDGVKRCTALHMAARRDNVEAADALLECGANIEARDSLGETPLRRAVNCGQTGVAALLLRKGANPHSVGSKGLTPLSAARSGPMRRLFETIAF